MIKKSIETKEYNIVTNDKPSESSTEDLLKQLYWLGTVTPRIRSEERRVGKECRP